MKFTAALTVVGFALTATSAMAAPILGGTNGGWRTGGGAQENLQMFWDGDSWDSHSTHDGQTLNPCNAGSLVAGVNCGLNAAALGAATAAGAPVNGSTFSMTTPGGAFEYWGNGDGSADLDFVFGEATGAWYDFSLLGEFSDDWGINEFGWYDANDPNSRTAIFPDAHTVGAANSVYIPGNFGFYYRNTSDPSEMFFTQTSLNLNGDKQQFAAFQIGDVNFLGVEDIFSNVITQRWANGTADYDYNDVMIGFTRSQAVPEPGTLLLMGLGIVGAATRLRRKTRV